MMAIRLATIRLILEKKGRSPGFEAGIRMGVEVDLGQSLQLIHSRGIHRTIVCERPPGFAPYRSLCSRSAKVMVKVAPARLSSSIWP